MGGRGDDAGVTIEAGADVVAETDAPAAAIGGAVIDAPAVATSRAGSTARDTGSNRTGSTSLTRALSSARAAAKARARASRSSIESVLPCAADAAALAPGVATGRDVGRGFSTAGAAACTGASGGISTPPGPSLRVFFFSTTTDFERPWLKFCRTWPDSTVLCSESGLRAPALSVLSDWSFESVMRFPFNLQMGWALRRRRQKKPDRLPLVKPGNARCAPPPSETDPSALRV